jgi:hypothetical protein
MKSARHPRQDLKTLTVFCLLAATAYPQAVSQPANNPPEKERPAVPVETVPSDSANEDELVILTPFEVSATTDRGYQATETLAGTRIRTDLKDVGGGLSVYTKEFLKDIGATDNATLLQYTTNAEVAGTRGTYAGLGNGQTLNEDSNLRAPAGAQRVRGLAAADTTRDFFVTDIPTDFYNVDRVDIQRGPNSILFGLGSPAGIVNASTRNADFGRNRGSVDARFGSYGTLRGNFDYNHVLIPKVLAIRIDGLAGNEKYQQEHAFQKDRRIYGAIRFDPKLFNRADFQTSFRAKFETGKIDANRPRITPPSDRISPWFRAAPTSTNPASIFTGMGKASINNGYDIGANPAAISPWISGYGNQQQPIWFVDGGSGDLARIYGGYINRGARNNDGSTRGSGDSILGQRFSGPFYSIASVNQYANDARLQLAGLGAFKDMSMRDSSIYNFYDTLIDGPNKSEWENWDTYNLTFSQSGWDNRVGVEVNYDRQKYDRGGQGMINPTINIDILRNFQDLSANPNFGRPFVGAGDGNGSSYVSDREYIRGSLFGELRATDFFDKESLIAKILGKHRLNGVYAKETYFTESRSWALNAHSLDWAAYWTRTTGLTTNFNDRSPLAVIYLGPSLANAAAASGANIPGVNANVNYRDGNIVHFDSTWIGGTNYSDPWTVQQITDAGLLPVYFASTTTPTNLTQASNPANYTGWNGRYQSNLLRSNRGANTDLLTGAQKVKRVTTSYAGSWQGYLWNDAIIPTVGWRYDAVETRNVAARTNPNNRAFLNLGTSAIPLPTVPPSQVDSYAFARGADDTNVGLTKNQFYSNFKDHSTSGGVVVHLNKLLGKRDILPLNVSASYNTSRNFQVTNARRDIYGKLLDNPTGETTDYGVLLSTKNGKYSFRAVKYKTVVENASIAADVAGLVGNPIQQGLRFRNVFLYKLSNYPWESREQNGDRNTWGAAYVDNTTGRPVAAGNSTTPPANSTLQTAAQATAMRDATIRAWNEIQQDLQAKGYFNYWGYTPPPVSSLTDRSTYEATLVGTNPAAQYAQSSSTVYLYSYPGGGPPGMTMTAETESEGHEFELTANPTANWRLSFNASETVAIRNNVGGPLIDEFVAYMDAKMAGTAGDMRQFSGGYSASNEVRANWNNQRSNYVLLKLQQGAAAAELRKWRYNVTSNYSFRRGLLKGTGVGASYRWQDKVVIGYPTIAGAGGLGSFDLSKPYYGPSEDGLDMWINYERKITKKLNWKIQLNVRNVFDKEGLIPITVQPDGQTWAGMRIKPVQEWFVTNTLSF